MIENKKEGNNSFNLFNHLPFKPLNLEQEPFEQLIEH